jgi:hypothetical protein
MGYYVACMAPTGIAARNLPGGRAVHNQFGFSITDTKRDLFLTDLSADLINGLHLRFQSEKLILIIIDEISYISPRCWVKSTIGYIN